jgi:asparagine synthase (glutamine-hydrolysing)
MCGICGDVSFRHTAAGPGLSPGSGSGASVGSEPGPTAVWRARRGRRVEAMLGALAHRGPDASGMHAGDDAVLGATRLAIRGVVDGRQPLVDEASGVVAVCNGEIDNHRELKAWLAERGRPVAQATDVAVIPGLYLELGDAFPEHLIGAFAIALWDPRPRRLLLVRDRAGEKPLFFRTDAAGGAGAGDSNAAAGAAGLAGAAGAPDGADAAIAAGAGGVGRALFATELAALVSSALPGEAWEEGQWADVEALAHYLRFGCFGVPRTPFARVQKVGPGERVVIEATGVRRERYWRWRTAPAARLGAPAPDAPDAADAPKAPMPPTRAFGEGRFTRTAGSLDAFDLVFRQAVARQADVEVPCGVFLSGGVDSSLVTAVARAVSPAAPLRAFSLRFPEASYDEGEVAARVAKLLGVTTTEVWVGPEDFMSCLPELVRMAGEPLADPAWVPAALLARRAAQEVRQVLVGEGGDELFGGYPTHSGVWLGERYERLPRPLRRLLADLVRRLPPSDKKVTLSFMLKRFVAGEGLPGLARHLLWTSNIAPDVLARLGLAGSPAGEAPAGMAVAAAPDTDLPAGSVLDHVQQYDLESSLAEGLLTKADRASMHFALELRAPFLDRDVMEFAATLPEAQRVRGLRTKVFLKRYALRYLPRWVVHRRKRGLSVPLASWLREPLRGWAEERLGSGRLGTVGVDEDAALALFGEHLRREGDHARALWSLVVLAEWLDWAAGLRGRSEAAQAGAAAEPALAAVAVAAPAAEPAVAAVAS